ncbi:hypothetical protein Q8A72_07055 [Aeribacillus pallidus]|nr:hypothetical protein [Aeribacillus pallidus]
MNDQERLQDIKNKFDFINLRLVSVNGLFVIDVDDLEWLIEQAEKAVISEELLDQQRAINMKIKLKYTKQKQQLKQAQTKAERYEKVLKQIASHELFTESYFCDLEANELIYKAQEALEGLNENAK